MTSMEAKLKRPEFIQAAINRITTSSFLFKGWAITIAAALSGFAAVDSKDALLTIAAISTTMFWGWTGTTYGLSIDSSTFTTSCQQNQIPRSTCR